MGDRTTIEWTDATWNPVRGCSRVSEGCRNCYAERFAARFSGRGQPYQGLARMTKDGPRWTGKLGLADVRLLDPVRWTKPRRIFVNSMSDLFHENLSLSAINKVFAVMGLCRYLGRKHVFQILTKRAHLMQHYAECIRNRRETREEIARLAVCLYTKILGIRMKARTDAAFHKSELLDYLSYDMTWPLGNVWMGVSIEDQKTADVRIPFLLSNRATVRWVSYEPALGRVDFSKYLSRLDWIVVGGESGPGARKMEVEWATSVRDQCAEHRVPFFFKQWGSWCRGDQLPAEAMRSIDAVTGVPPNPEIYYCMGKKTNNRRLFGRVHSDFPTEF